MPVKSNDKSRMPKLLRDILEITETVIIAVFSVTLVFTFIFRMATVSGRSMENTLLPDDRIVSSTLFYSVECGDIIIINADNSVLFDDNNNLKYGTGLGKQIVKRVIATGGQTVDIDFEKGTVSVDGNILNEGYITGLTHLDEGAFTGKYPITIPEGYCFVMGDNRGISKDSRSVEVGLIPEEEIAGEVIMVISPFHRIGFVK